MVIVSGADGRSWTFLTNHARVLIHIARNPSVRLRDIAAGIGITERATQHIVADLQHAGYITVTRMGRRNHYAVNPDRPFRHPADASRVTNVQALIDLFNEQFPVSSPAQPSAGVADQEAHR